MALDHSVLQTISELVSVFINPFPAVAPNHSASPIQNLILVVSGRNAVATGIPDNFTSNTVISEIRCSTQTPISRSRRTPALPVVASK